MSAQPHEYTVPLNERGTFTLPKAIRAKLPKGAVLVIHQRYDGVIEIQPRVLTDLSQAWFWSPEWQRREREADIAYAEGRYHEFEDANDLLAHLDSLEAT